MKNKYFEWFHFEKRSWVEILLGFGIIAFLFSFFMINGQLEYPFTRDKMKKYHFEKVDDIPLVNGIALSDYVFPDKEANLAQKEAARDSVPPIFFQDQTISQKMLKDYEKFYSIIQSGLSKHQSPEQIQKRIAAKLDILMPVDLIQTILDKNNTELLLDQCSVAINNLTVVSILSSDFVNSGLFRPNQTIRIVSDKEMANAKDVVLGQVPTEKQALRQELDLMRAIVSQSVLNQSARIIEFFVYPNTQYHSILTQKAKKVAERSISPCYIGVKKGEIIFNEGEPLTALQVKKIEGLSSVRALFYWPKVLFSIIYLLVLLLFFRLFFHPPFISSKLKTNQLGVLYLLLIFGCLYSMLAAAILPESMIQIARLFPLVLIVHVSAVLISLKGGFYLGLIFTMLQPLFYLFCPDADVNLAQTTYVLVFFGVLPSAITSWFVRQLEHVVDFFLTGLWIFLSTMILYVLYQIIIIPYQISSLIMLFYCFLNAVILLLMAPGLILLLEKLFNLTTDHRLVELGNTSLPIFKQMMKRSPGTYAHSLKVASIAEYACNAIGARGILARVGAYYHDIGKIEIADYFTENQTVDNKHDEIRPQLSASLICSHVAKGIEKAKQLNLPKEIIDIIQQHHGTSAVKYFLTVAQKDPNATIVNDSDYRYDGPIPQTKEAAVVMLADCVEAASRSMKNSNKIELDRLIWKIIRDKLDDHQLSNSKLTFDELEIIKQSFIEILLGDHHTRIAYPEDIKPGNKGGEK